MIVFHPRHDFFYKGLSKEPLAQLYFYISADNRQTQPLPYKTSTKHTFTECIIVTAEI